MNEADSIRNILFTVMLPLMFPSIYGGSVAGVCRGDILLRDLADDRRTG